MISILGEIGVSDVMKHIVRGAAALGKKQEAEKRTPKAATGRKSSLSQVRSTHRDWGY